MTKREFLDRAREKHGYKYHYVDLPEKILSKDYIYMYLNGIKYRQSVYKHIIGRSPEKNTPRRTTDQFIKESIEIWGNKYDYSLVDYKNHDTKVKIIYEGIIYEQIAGSHLKGLNCEFILNKDSFIKRSNEVHKNRYDYTKVEFINGDTPVIIGYMGKDFLQKPYSHLSGARPENYKLSVRKTTDQFIEEANIIHDNKYSYIKTDYEKNQIKIIITCPIHGDFNQTPLSHLQGCGCPNCNESRGESKITKFLNRKKINYIRQHKFDDCKNIFQLPFDFYIPSKRICIEFDGIQHYEPIEFFGGVEAYNRIKLNDKIKSEYCEENFINLIRIKYDQIENIQDILSKYF